MHPYRRLASVDQLTTRPPVEIDLDVSFADDRAIRVHQSARENGFALTEQIGPTPQVYLFGCSHSRHRFDQEAHLINVFGNTMQAGYIHLSEGSGPLKLSYDLHSHTDDLIGTLKPFFIDNKIQTMYNDDLGYMVDHSHATAALNRFISLHPDYDTHPDYPAIADLCATMMRRRDHSMTDNDLTGIIPLVQGRADGQEPLAPDSRIYQVFGLCHAYAGTITNRLKDAGIGYLSFIARNHGLIGTDMGR